MLFSLGRQFYRSTLYIHHGFRNGINSMRCSIVSYPCRVKEIDSGVCFPNWQLQKPGPSSSPFLLAASFHSSVMSDCQTSSLQSLDNTASDILPLVLVLTVWNFNLLQISPPQRREGRCINHTSKNDHVYYCRHPERETCLRLLRGRLFLSLQPRTFLSRIHFQEIQSAFY